MKERQSMGRIVTIAETPSKHVCANVLIVAKSTHVNVVCSMLLPAANLVAMELS